MGLLVFRINPKINMKGKILEFVVRKILYNCGFTSVRSDGLYIYDRHPLQMINGKGAAHDADVLMNPPIQMPFSYPTRIIYECKAYESSRKVGLNVVRSAAGLRNDINDFEIVTEDFLTDRQNNARAVLAASPRKRHYYQVGVATLHEFSKPALEFAANNKIPLLSLDDIFSGTGLADSIQDIPDNLGPQLSRRDIQLFRDELSKKDIDKVKMDRVREIAYQHESINRCLDLIERYIDNVYAGILESGELIFIRRESNGVRQRDLLSNNQVNNLTARLFWGNEDRERWYIEFEGSEMRYFFYLPTEIATIWKSYEDAKFGALQVKGDRFARFFVFNKHRNEEGLPFKLIRLDKVWLQRLIDQE